MLPREHRQQAAVTCLLLLSMPTQERSELISAHKAELDALLEKRGALEQSFMDQYLKACEAYEVQLESMRTVEADECTTQKRRYVQIWHHPSGDTLVGCAYLLLHKL